MVFDFNTTRSLSEASKSSCTDSIFEGCHCQCRNQCNHQYRNYQCRPCSINCMINDHTYTLIRKICRKVIRDYQRQQCRERYTLFDGGNSINVRIHRSSCVSVEAGRPKTPANGNSIASASKERDSLTRGSQMIRRNDKNDDGRLKQIERSRNRRIVDDRQNTESNRWNNDDDDRNYAHDRARKGKDAQEKSRNREITDKRLEASRGGRNTDDGRINKGKGARENNSNRDVDENKGTGKGRRDTHNDDTNRRDKSKKGKSVQQRADDQGGSDPSRKNKVADKDKNKGIAGKEKHNNEHGAERQASKERGKKVILDKNGEGDNEELERSKSRNSNDKEKSKSNDKEELSNKKTSSGNKYQTKEGHNDNDSGSKKSKRIRADDLADEIISSRENAPRQKKDNTYHIPVISDLRMKVRNGHNVIPVEAYRMEVKESGRKFRDHSKKLLAGESSKDRLTKKYGSKSSKRRKDRTSLVMNYRFARRSQSRLSRYDEIKTCDILRAHMEERELCERKRNSPPCACDCSAVCHQPPICCNFY